jgi:HEAT repeat protein
MFEWFLSSCVLAIGGLTLGGLWSQRKRLEHWRKLAESHGLEVVRMSSQAAMLLKLEARAGPISVRIRDTRNGQRIVVAFPGPPGFTGVRIRREAYRPPGAREAGVRLRNLLLLAREFPERPETLELLRAACSDPSPEVRLRAALEMGAEGRAILMEFAEDTEGTADDGHSALAISRLDRELPFERTRAILGNALRKRRVRTAHACLEMIGRSGEAEAVDVLVKVLAIERGELATVAALALGTAGDPAAEPSLLLALRRDRVDVRVAAATALGRVGSAAAVLPLKEAAESSRDKELNRATRQAIAEIQSRLQGASPGQLSLAGAEEGQLSLPESEAGQLSLAQAEAGQVSLAPAEPFRLSQSGAREGLQADRGGAA